MSAEMQAKNVLDLIRQWEEAKKAAILAEEDYRVHYATDFLGCPDRETEKGLKEPTEEMRKQYALLCSQAQRKEARLMELAAKAIKLQIDHAMMSIPSKLLSDNTDSLHALFTRGEGS